MNPTKLPDALYAHYVAAWTNPEFRQQTSYTMLEDLYYFCKTNANKGSAIVELGCYRGGSSLTLAYVANELEKPFFIVDNDAANLDFTCRLIVRDLKIMDPIIACRGTLLEFVREFPLNQRPLLVFVDGDHDYGAVLVDISAIFEMKNTPAAVAFHDYSLRSAKKPATGVKRAVDEMFMGAKVTPMGEKYGRHPDHDEKNPDADGCWWDPNGSEGALILGYDFPNPKGFPELN